MPFVVLCWNKDLQSDRYARQPCRSARTDAAHDLSARMKPRGRGNAPLTDHLEQKRAQCASGARKLFEYREVVVPFERRDAAGKAGGFTCRSVFPRLPLQLRKLRRSVRNRERR